MNRENRKLKAKETLAIIKTGKYKIPNNINVKIAFEINQSIENTELYSVQALNDLNRTKNETDFQTSLIKFNKNYFSLTILLLILEIYIGTYVHDDFVRPYVGDFLVVILLYCLVKSFWIVKPFKAAMYILVFSFSIEILQYFKIVEILGLQDIKLARIIIGTTFVWEDLLAYLLGVLLVLFIEKNRLVRW